MLGFLTSVSYQENYTIISYLTSAFQSIAVGVRERDNCIKYVKQILYDNGRNTANSERRLLFSLRVETVIDITDNNTWFEAN